MIAHAHETKAIGWSLCEKLSKQGLKNANANWYAKFAKWGHYVNNEIWSES